MLIAPWPAPTVLGSAPSIGQALVCILLAAIGMGLVWRAAGMGPYRRTAGRFGETTAVAPLGWIQFALALQIGVQLALALGSQRFASTWADPLRYAAAVAFGCPAVALLGAKRPQDRLWQWIVATLWLVLQIPSGHWLLFRPDATLQIPAPWSWMLVFLIVLPAACYAATRFWPSALFYCAAQALLVGPFLPLGFPAGRAPGSAAGRDAMALGMCLLAALLVATGTPRPAAARGGLDRAWIDFRDLFGTFWALRAEQRINAWGRSQDLGTRVGWNGFAAGSNGEPIPKDEYALAERALRSTLWRFVSQRWIDERLAGT